MSDEIQLNFEDFDALNEESDGRTLPPKFPQGVYVATAHRPQPKIIKVERDGVKVEVTVIDINYTPTDTHKGVDPDDLAEEGINIGQRQIKGSIFCDAGNMSQLNALYEACGIEDFEGQAHHISLAKVADSQLLISVKHSKDGLYANVVGFEKLEG